MLVSILPAAALAAQLVAGPAFETRRQLAVAGKPESLLAADLDGDRRVELVAALRERGELVVWAGTEHGLSREPRTVAIDGWPLRPLALPAGAFGTPPGVRLVAVASRAARNLVLYDLTGEAPPRELWRGARERSTPRALAVGDLGAELAIAIATDGRELVLVGESSVRTVPLAHDVPRCALLLADGSAVVVGFQDSRTLEALAPGSDAPLAVLQLDGFPRDLVEIDLDRDGDLELVAVGGDGDAWAFGHGRLGGAGAWMAEDAGEPLRWSVGSIPIDVEVADLDRDGTEELGVLTRFGLGYELGGPETSARGYAGQTPTALALADLDGDGALDLAIANRDARAVSVIRGDGAGGVRDATHARVGVTPTSLAVADLTGDGLADVATLNSKTLSLSVLRNDGGVLRPFDEVRVGPSPRALTIVRPSGARAPELALLAQDASGAWIETFALPATGLVARAAAPWISKSGSALVALDLIPGGGAELVVADPDAGELIGLRSLADGGGELFRASVPSSPVALVPVELDGDARPELAVALGAPGARTGIALIDVVDGADGGLAAVELALVPCAGWPIDLAVADLNDDGRDDLAVLALAQPASVEGHLQALVCDGDTGAFVPGARVPTGARPHHVAAGDVDGDGLSDLFVDSQNDHVVRGWLTRGAEGGVSFERLDDLGAHLGCLDVVLADVDGDGALDLVVANGFSDDVSTIFNRPR